MFTKANLSSCGSVDLFHQPDIAPKPARRIGNGRLPSGHGGVGISTPGWRGCGSTKWHGSDTTPFYLLLGHTRKDNSTHDRPFRLLARARILSGVLLYEPQKSFDDN